MKIILNGDSKEIKNRESLQTLLSGLNIPLDGQGVAVCLNEEIIPKLEWQDKILNENDILDVIFATQGG